MRTTLRVERAATLRDRDAGTGLAELLSRKLIGQPEAIEAIVPYVQLFQAGLSPSGRPAGVFLLLGPTGTGKTRTVEVLAEVLHGSPKHVLKVDCGEFQLDHEVAKLIGAPPGYLGHRETQPLLTQQKLNLVTTERCGLSLVLFDEIEKAAPSLTRLLLGVLDKATLRLGDNTSVSFERSLIFLTSNLGGADMVRELSPGFGFQAAVPRPAREKVAKLAGIGAGAARRKFSPEFLNRIDRIVTYRPLGADSLAEILNQHIQDFQRHIENRLGTRSFQIEVPEETRQVLLRKGTSTEFGARELKRTFHRHLVEPLAALLCEGEIEPGASVRLAFDRNQERLSLEVAAGASRNEGGYG